MNIFKQRRQEEPLWCGFNGEYRYSHVDDNHIRRYLYDEKGQVKIIDYCLTLSKYKVFELNCKKVDWIEDR